MHQVYQGLSLVTDDPDGLLAVEKIHELSFPITVWAKTSGTHAETVFLRMGLFDAPGFSAEAL
jgi:hypothetical protein